MIIKEVRIGAFGALKNKTIKFQNGMNIVYGENEKGKSTIESFIKIMLYGFNKKGGRDERNRYLPLDGNIGRGELLVEYLGKDVIVKKSFGKTKKEDISLVLDGVSGEEICSINKEEPGKTFFNINKKTFEKTLFISQLGVTVSKDKEEEIMQKITNIFGCSEEEIPVNKALEKLEIEKKTLTTTRGLGLLDRLKNNKAALLEERYEGYKISEKNLEWENELLLQRDKKQKIKDEIDNLEVYKKYLKKISIQKEYKEITDYLRKSEELKREEDKIVDDLKSEKGIIDEYFLDELKEINKKYLETLDENEEIKNTLSNLNEDKILLNRKFERYKYLDLFDGDIKDKLISLKYEMEYLNNNLNNKKSLYKDIENQQKKLKQNQEAKKLLMTENIKEESENLFKVYEEKLREISYIAQNQESIKELEDKIHTQKIKKIISVVVLVLGIALTFLGFPIIILALILIIGGGLCLYKVSEVSGTLNSYKKAETKINELSEEINNIEDKLNDYVYKVKAKDYKGLLLNIKKYTSLSEDEEKLVLQIQEKKKLLDEEEYLKLTKKYKKNIEMITSIKNVSNRDRLEEVIEDISSYTDLKARTENIEDEIKEKGSKYNELESEIGDLEVILNKKLEIMGLNLTNLLDLEIYIKEYKEKIRKRKEIHGSLTAIEDTYKVLLKDRNIESIKDELKDIISDNYQYNYKSEEDIEKEEKSRNAELIECEKLIKDIENNINTRLIGKRDLIEIEEEINNTDKEIESKEKLLNALEISSKCISEALGEVRQEVGPLINKNIAENFSKLTDGRYNEVMLGDNYDMVVRDGTELISSEYLSNGALDQLYLSLRIAFIQLLFKNEEYPIILDDAFIQYDDHRRKKALNLLSFDSRVQKIIFTCQTIDQKILEELKVKFDYIEI